MKSLKNYLGKASGVYGILHAIGCPYHGLLGLALKSGMVLHPSVTKVVELPHEIATHHVFEPAWNLVLKKDENSEPEKHFCGSCDTYHFKGSFQEALSSKDLEFKIETTSPETRHERVHRYAHTTSDVTGWAAFLGFLGFTGYRFIKRRKNSFEEDCPCENHKH